MHCLIRARCMFVSPPMSVAYSGRSVLLSTLISSRSALGPRTHCLCDLQLLFRQTLKVASTVSFQNSAVPEKASALPGGGHEKLNAAQDACLNWARQVSDGPGSAVMWGIENPSPRPAVFRFEDVRLAKRRRTRRPESLMVSAWWALAC